jgi:putative membrane protein
METTEALRLHWEGGWDHGPGMMWGSYYGMGWPWILFMLVFWVAAIVGIAALIRWLVLASRPGAGARGEESAIEVLKKRYARGEIGKEEFEEKKKDLL